MDQTNSRLHSLDTNHIIQTLACNWPISVKSRENDVTFAYFMQFLVTSCTL